MEGGEREGGKGGSRALRGNRSLLKLNHPDRARPERRKKLFLDMKLPADSTVEGLSAGIPSLNRQISHHVDSLGMINWVNLLPTDAHGRSPIVCINSSSNHGLFFYPTSS